MKFFNKGKKQIIENNVKSLSDKETVAEKKRFIAEPKLILRRKKRLRVIALLFIKRFLKLVLA